jgi:hypothetical protein
MKQEGIRELGEGLLAQLRLSPAEAAVMLDARAKRTLRVYIFDKAASRRVKQIVEWRGFHVAYVSGLDARPH